MNTVLAFWPIRAEASHVELAELPPDMSLAASWPLLTETFVVLLAHGQLGTFFHVDVEAFVSILAVAILVEKLTLAHLSQVVLV
jgi:hypothetical protein